MYVSASLTTICSAMIWLLIWFDEQSRYICNCLANMENLWAGYILLSSGWIHAWGYGEAASECQGNPFSHCVWRRSNLRGDWKSRPFAGLLSESKHSWSLCAEEGKRGFDATVALGQSVESLIRWSGCSLLFDTGEAFPGWHELQAHGKRRSESQVDQSNAHCCYQ